jgi:hypothetical protein
MRQDKLDPKRETGRGPRLCRIFRRLISALRGKSGGALLSVEARVVGGDALVPRVGWLGLAFSLGREGPNYHHPDNGCGGVSVHGMSVEVR